MIIRRLSVTNVRSHTEKVIDISAGTTILSGKNGIGKTSLLEAIYIALQGSSFKGSDMDILRHGEPWYRIDILLDDDTTRTVTFDPSRASGKKKFLIHEKVSYRLSPKDKYPVVLFEPEDLRLLHGSPSRRRLFIDRFIAQIDQTYVTTARKYERALKQRNTLLKHGNVLDEDLFVWNVALSEYGAKIMEQRVRAIETINKELSSYYSNISHTEDDISMHYSHTYVDNSSQKLLNELESKIHYDRAVKHTSVGPHRHDVVFSLNSSPATSVASRGEVRTIVLALKRIEINLIERLTSLSPIVLLDDVFSDLDSDRQSVVGSQFTGAQTIITGVDSPEAINDTHSHVRIK